MNLIGLHSRCVVANPIRRSEERKPNMAYKVAVTTIEIYGPGPLTDEKRKRGIKLLSGQSPSVGRHLLANDIPSDTSLRKGLHVGEGLVGYIMSDCIN